MINKNAHIKCGWCDAVHEASVWISIAFESCTNREMKRAFLDIYNEKAFDRKNPHYYKCPSCNTWSKGSQLSIVDTDNPKLLKLGREPVMKTNENL